MDRNTIVIDDDNNQRQKVPYLTIPYGISAQQRGVPVLWTSPIVIKNNFDIESPYWFTPNEMLGKCLGRLTKHPLNMRFMVYLP